jgi:hypothetical protein
MRKDVLPDPLAKFVADKDYGPLWDKRQFDRIYHSFSYCLTFLDPRREAGKLPFQPEHISASQGVISIKIAQL